MQDNIMPESLISNGNMSWRDRARYAYRESTDYINQELVDEWAQSADLARSKHHKGSRYFTDKYKYRNKIFRPKTREAINRAVAMFATSMFSTADQVNIEAVDTGNEKQQATAEFLSEILNIRLDKHLNWYLLATGAFKSALIYGFVVSKQSWEYRTEEQTLDLPVYDENGNMMLNGIGKPLLRKQKKRVVVSDKPRIEVIPAEKFRISPAAHWSDPISTSPYLIHIVPMYIWQVERMMQKPDPKTGQTKWKKLTASEIFSYGTPDEHSQYTVKHSREGRRGIPEQSLDNSVLAYSVVNVHENIMRDDSGIDYVFFTLGTEFLLNEPQPLRDVYPDGRPFVFGKTDIEPDRLYPDGLPQVVKGLQIQANAIVNQRLDNVEQAMNKRMLVKKGAGVSLAELTRSVPGGLVFVDQMDDVMEMALQDVTQSSYQEQPLVDADFDSIAGQFNAASVQTNRALNETVGGLTLLSNDADRVTEFKVRTFASTWVEPVLRQILKLEQRYENDEIIMMMAGDSAQLVQKFGIDQPTDMMLRGEFSTSVNIGMGNTNPQAKIQQLMSGIQAVGQLAPAAMEMLNHEAIISEIMGALGHKDGKRFFKLEGDPQLQQLQQQIQQLQQQLQSQQELIALEKEKLANRSEVEKMKGEFDLQQEAMRSENDIAVAEIQAASRLDNEQRSDGTRNGTRNFIKKGATKAISP